MTPRTKMWVAWCLIFAMAGLALGEALGAAHAFLAEMLLATFTFVGAVGFVLSGLADIKAQQAQDEAQDD